jgi:hypothetical protein
VSGFAPSREPGPRPKEAARMPVAGALAPAAGPRRLGARRPRERRDAMAGDATSSNRKIDCH